MTAPSESHQVKGLVDAFIELEEQLGLWDLRACGRPYWHYVRYEVFIKVLQSRGLSGRAHGSWRDRSLLSWARFDMEELKQERARSDWSDLSTADLLVLNHPRHILRNGQWICPYSNPLLEEFPGSYWAIEQGFQGRHYHPNGTQRAKYLEWEKAKAYVRFFASHPYSGGVLTTNERRDIADWAASLKRHLGAGPDRTKAVSLVRSAVRRSAGLGDLYERLLDRTQPKAILQVVHYGYRNLTMTERARGRGIPVVEVQHGFIGPTHLAYSFASGRLPEAFPDYVLLFGTFWRNMTPAFPLPPERTPAIGYSQLDDASKAASSRQDLGAKKNLLILSQGTIGPELSRFALDLSHAIDRTRYSITYKLHPSEMASWRERYPHLLGSAITVCDDPKTDLYDLFRSSYIQIGVYSTAIFEGLGFHLPTFVVTLPGHEHMTPFLEKGYVTPVSKPDEIIGALDSLPEQPSQEALDALWQRDPRSRFTDFMNTLISAE